MGEAVLSAVLPVLFDRLASRYVGDFIRGCNLEKQLKKLEKTLKNVNSFLNDAENKQYKMKPVKEWLDDLRDAAYDAEDLIDDIATEALRDQLFKSKLSQTSSRKVSFSFLQKKMSSKITKVKDTKKARKIKAITRRFEELVGERSQLGLEEINDAGSSSLIVFRETSSLVDESHVFGRDKDKAKIIDLLLLKEQSASNYGNELIVIPIVGMGGVGKTTLAQLVYNDNNLLKDNFDSKAWVCVSSVELDVKVITRSVLKSITNKDISHLDELDQLQGEVKKQLTGRRFLIVLDDVWNKNYLKWDLLRQPFGVGASGSAIIVTTRDGEIGSNIGTVDNYFLGKLSEDDCWSIFVQHAFGIRRTVDADPDLIVTGKKIVQKCDGLPLAAKSLGGLLRSKEESEWEYVLNCEIWDLPVEEIEILPVLKLSYYYLPSHLKRCFAYCSIFPEDYEFEEEELVWLWMAEGFLEQPNGQMELEEFGRKCFRVLLSRSFFQSSSRDKLLYVMHDLMRNLAQWAAGQTCLRLEALGDGSRQSRQIIKVRHLSYICCQYVQNFEVLSGVEFLRTVLLLGFRSWYQNLVTLDLFSKSKFLRVLSLCGYNIFELPSSIGDLKHLRYIDISETNIQSVPESVSTLYNLQTLLCKSCPKLTKLPEELRSLINLRHFDISNASLDWMEAMPPQIGSLTSLRNLSDFVVGKDNGCGIGELANFKHLEGKLRISKLENVIDDSQAKMANLSDKKGLNVLEMKWCSQFDDRPSESVEKDVLNMLRPHEKLKKLSIKCYGGQNFPWWIGHASFSNMVFVELEGCERCTDLPPLGQLPLLKDLCIRRMNGIVTVGPGFYGEGYSNPFPSLETLSFEDMKEWRDWLPCVEEKRDKLFALLRELSLKECPNLLGSLPDHLPSLEKLTVHECERLTVSISSHPKLCWFNISHCQDVVQRSNVNLSSLKYMYLRHVSRATFLTEDLENVGYEELEIGWCENIENLNGLHNWRCLVELRIQECPKLVSFPVRGFPATLRRLGIHKCNALESVSEAISWHNCNNSSLEYLYIESCHSLTSIARASLISTVKELSIVSCHSLQSLLNEDDEASTASLMMQDSSNSHTSLLEVLYIDRCPSLKSLFSSSSRGELPASLKSFEIENCPKLESLGERFLSHTSLDRIQILSCKSIKYLPENLHNLTGLSHFYIRECPSLVRFPDGGLLTANLKGLWIVECEKLEALPNLTSLQELHIWNCPGIVSIPQNEGFPTNITRLQIEGPNICKALIQWGLHRLSSLRILSVDGGESPDLLSFPVEQEISMVVVPSSLIKMDISNFPNLESLSSIGFQNLASLEELRISNCPKLQFFPEKGLLFPSLLRLDIYKCPLLKQWCQRDQGQEFPKISHVSCVQIDGRPI